MADVDLQEIEAIKRLKYRYMRCLDQKHWEEMRTLFVDDATARYSDGMYSFDSADVVMMIGNNPLISSFSPQGTVPAFSAADKLRKEQRRGLRLVCIDPRRTELARQADLHLQPVPGEDPTLLAGLLRVILNEGLHDVAFCERYVDGVDALRDAVQPFDLDYVSRMSFWLDLRIIGRTITMLLARAVGA